MEKAKIWHFSLTGGFPNVIRFFEYILNNYFYITKFIYNILLNTS